MKKIATLLLTALFTCYFISAQQGVGINTDGSLPHPSAMLDIKSTNKGLLIPRMTSSERGAIESPALGLLVYETTSNSIWAFNGIGWIQLGAGGVSGSSPWNISGNNIYNANTGLVGIGTSSPEEKLHLNGNLRINNSNPIIQFQQAAVNKGYLQLSGDNLRIGTNSGNTEGSFIVRMNAEERLVIDKTGKVGIGTTTPGAKLEVAGNVLLNSGSPTLKFRRDGTGGIFGFAYVDFLNSDNAVRFRFLEHGTKFNMGRPNTFGIYPDLTIDEDNGNVGIGTAEPIVKLDVNGNTRVSGDVVVNEGLLRIFYPSDSKFWQMRYSTSENGLFFEENGADRLILKNGGDVTINGTSPTLQLMKSGVDKGFVQLSGDNLRIGTNSSNTNGSFVVRVNGSDRLTIDGGGAAFFSGSVNAAYNANIQGDASVKGYLNVGSTQGGAGYLLRVGGKVICEEVRVKLLSSGWPDYVFSEKYKLPTLQELQSFIKKNKHLPNIPSAAEIEKSGIELGDMQKRMMEKIEELTLYILQLEEKTQKLQAEIDNLGKQLRK